MELLSYFPSGTEINLSVDRDLNNHKAIITIRREHLRDIMYLLLMTDAFRRQGVKEIHLEIPYLPYARQDRVMNPGEPFSLKVFADLLNLQNFASVTMFDVHSDVATALINNSVSIPNYELVRKSLGLGVVICPDAGAYKKIYKTCQAVGYTGEIILCNKIRNTATGEITGTKVFADDINGQDCYIIDDICDGGATFVGIAKELKKKNAGDVYLIVSHGIFSKGTNLEGIKHTFTTDSFCYDQNNSKLTVWTLSSVMKTA